MTKNLKNSSAARQVQEARKDRGAFSALLPLRLVIFHMMARFIGLFLRQGQLKLSYQGRAVIALGDKGVRSACIRLNRLSALWRVLFRPSLSIGEAYMDGGWEVKKEDLPRFIGLLLLNSQRIEAGLFYRIITKFGDVLEKISPKNDASQSRRNASHHYDIGNTLYQSFLDKEMLYSCAFFEKEGDSLEKAQKNKLATTTERLALEKGMSVLDIGCGWGALARALARKGAVVEGLTLADEQLALAKERTPATLRKKITFHLCDYRDHAEKNPESYDRVVSVGMFEHVGREHFENYFAAVRRLLKPNGRAVIHSIVKPTRLRTSLWMRKYIFPGGYIPQLEEMFEAVEKAGLSLAHAPYLHEGWHYAATLHHWRERFNANYAHLDHSRYDERFWRMWNFYLAGSQAAFEALNYQVVQIAVEKRN